MPPVENNAAALTLHVNRTYLNLRFGTGLIGAALPVLLWIGGLFRTRIDLLPSMSASTTLP